MSLELLHLGHELWQILTTPTYYHFLLSFHPKVRALQSGMVLVVDEADKAPTHVTCILKNIIEGGEITLADGRRIVQGMWVHVWKEELFVAVKTFISDKHNKKQMYVYP